MLNGEATEGNSNGHAISQSNPPPLPLDAPPVPAEAPAAEPGGPPLPQEVAGTSGSVPDADPLLVAEAAAEEEPGPSGNVEAWPVEETAMSAEEEQRLLKVRIWLTCRVVPRS